MNRLPLHGGDLAAAESRWGCPQEGWLDLSTGINPWPYPLPEIASDDWSRLPDAAAHAALLSAAAARWGVQEPAGVVAGAGSQALIQALPRIIPPTDAAILGPTYGEHGRAWTAAGHRVREIARIEERGDASILVVVNPNNPDGATLAPRHLLDLAADMAERGGLLVVDEAFADQYPALSVAGMARPGLVVLRSFGKFYGMAGLRLGFAVAPAPLAARLEAHLGPWPVSGPALAVGRAALADEAWSALTIQRLSEASERLDAILIGAGLAVVGGTGLFRLVSHPEAATLYEGLGRSGILVRAFAFRSDWLRVGLPGSEMAERRLETALRQNILI